MHFTRIEFTGQRKVFLAFHADFVRVLINLQQGRLSNEIRHSGQSKNGGTAVGPCAVSDHHLCACRSSTTLALGASLCLSVQVARHYIQFVLSAITEAVIHFPRPAKIYCLQIFALQSRLLYWSAGAAGQQCTHHKKCDRSRQCCKRSIHMGVECTPRHSMWASARRIMPQIIEARPNPVAKKGSGRTPY